MTWKTRLLARESIFTAVAFTAASYLYYLVAYWGVRDHFVEGPLKDYLESRAVYVELLLAGVLFGGLIGVINRLAETPKLRRRSFSQIVLLRTALFLGSGAIVAGLIVLVFAWFILSWAELADITQALTIRYVLSFVLWMVLVVGGINFSLEIFRVVGAGNLWRLLIGRYRRPREEQRIFLFMDLKGSTTTAEKLGHQRYSAMIQKCFQDLTQVALRYEAAIYQYVGDEVVLSWPITKGMDIKKNSVHAFFDYQRALLENKEAYERRFGVMPEFRGGIDAGAVIVTEVGDVKREIVYHGDVLNTAARLLELCKKRGERLMVSHLVGEAMEQEAEIGVSWHGEVALRGKLERITAYSLYPESDYHQYSDKRML